MKKVAIIGTVLVALGVVVFAMFSVKQLSITNYLDHSDRDFD